MSLKFLRELPGDCRAIATLNQNILWVGCVPVCSRHNKRTLCLLLESTGNRNRFSYFGKKFTFVDNTQIRGSDGARVPTYPRRL